MKYRKLRIAVTALSLTASVLFILLWVRSYWWSDIVSYCPGKATMYRAYSRDGLVIFRESSQRLLMMHTPPELGWTLRTTWSPYQSREVANAPALKRALRRLSWRDGHIPYWLPVIFPAVFGAAPWLFNLRCRFSLRTLLIATALVAVGLGMVVALI